MVQNKFVLELWQIRRDNFLNKFILGIENYYLPNIIYFLIYSPFKFLQILK